MKVAQLVLSSPAFDDAQIAPLRAIEPQFVLVFGAVPFFSDPAVSARLRSLLPGVKLLGCSTAGEIHGTVVGDGEAVLTAVHFAHARIGLASSALTSVADSREAGRRVGAALLAPDLAGIFVVAPGTNINGSDLVEGLAAGAGSGVAITGGLAGDGTRFERTWTLGDGGCSDHEVVVLGFYGKEIAFGRGSYGGWKPFGPERRVTRCEGNILHELDGQPALQVYEKYLGDYAGGLPASGLLFPFEMVGEGQAHKGLIRTILGVDRASGSLTLAGAIAPGGNLMLMHASTDGLVDGAEAAANMARDPFPGIEPGLAILVSCVGRKLVMGERVDEEVDAVAGALGGAPAISGFYSYGEIGPFASGSSCQLHNQTMTVTWLGERAAAP